MSDVLAWVNFVAFIVLVVGAVAVGILARRARR